MKYLICNHCQHKNPALSERLVFCSQCNKKLANNFMDWQKTKFNTSFEAYIKDLKTDDSIEAIDEKVTAPEKNHLFSRKTPLFKSGISKKSAIFISALLCQIFLFVFLLYQQKSPLFFSSNPSEQTYLSETQWKQHSITADLSITLPFELKESSSVLPYYLENYASTRTQKSESSKSFSVTIEEITIEGYHNSIYLGLLNVTDEYMQNPNTYFTSQENIEHFTINAYKTYSQQGSYTLDGHDYLYENYTLVKGNKAFKIVMSYLQHDDLLNHYAAIVSNSLLSNHKTI